MDLNRTLEVEDLGQGDEADHGVCAIKCRGCIDDPRLSGCRIWIHRAGVAVAHDGDVAVHVAVLEGEKLEVDTVRPVEELHGEAGHHGQGLELGAVALAVTVLEGVDHRGQDAALPWPDVFSEEAVQDVDWVQVEVSADLRVLCDFVSSFESSINVC